MNPVDLAMQKAQQQQAEASAIIEQTQQTQPTTAVAAPGRPVTLGDLLASVDVDRWVKTNEYGLVIGQEEHDPIKELSVVFNSERMVLKERVRFGNPAVYRSSRDRAVCDETGDPWPQVIKFAQRQDARAYPYMSADLMFGVPKDVVSPDGKVVAEAGMVLGYTSPPSAKKDIATFVKELDKKGLLEQDLLVKIRSRKMTNNNQNKWSILSLELVGPYQPN